MPHVYRLTITLQTAVTKQVDVWMRRIFPDWQTFVIKERRWLVAERRLGKRRLARAEQELLALDFGDDVTVLGCELMLETDPAILSKLQEEGQPDVASQ